MRKVILLNIDRVSEYNKVFELTDDQFRLLEYLSNDFVLSEDIEWYEIKDGIKV